MIKIVLLILLAILGIYMIYLGMQTNMQPPVYTGIGFILIALLLGIDKGK